MQNRKRRPSRLPDATSASARPRRRKNSFWANLAHMKPRGYAVCLGALLLCGGLLYAAGAKVVQGMAVEPEIVGEQTLSAEGDAGSELSAGLARSASSLATAAKTSLAAAQIRPISLQIPLASRVLIPAGADEIVVPAQIPALPEEAPAQPSAPQEETPAAEAPAVETPVSAPASVTVTTTGAENLSYWHSVNSDVIGWLKVPTTNINYPVVKGPNTNYYIDKDIYGNYSVNGVIWADSDISTGSRSQLSNNTVIYGHNWTNYSATPAIGRSGDVMFAQLTSLQHLSVAKQIPYIYYSTTQEEMAWQVFAAFYTDTNLDYISTDPGSGTMQYIIDEAIARSEHIYDVSVSSSDKILTLSTCTRRFGARSDQRFVVMAKLVDGTSGLPSVSITANPSPKRPQF